MPYEPGRLLLVAYPFTDHTTGKERPVLVISGMDFNRGEDVVVVPLSSRVVPNDPFGFPISDTEPYFPQTRLTRSSSVKWSKPMTISSKVVVRKLGMLPPAELKQVQEKVQSLFG